MDEADTANEYAEHARACAIRSIAGAMRGRGEALAFCLECEEPIPEARQLAMPGAEYCVVCQSWLDKGGKFYP